MANIISIDAGSSSLRSVLYESGVRRFLAQRTYQAQFLADGSVLQDPLEWKNALYETLKDVADHAREYGISVDALSLTSQRSSVFAVDAQGNALCHAMTWHDKRSVPICKELRAHESFLYRMTGLRLDPMFSAPKMAWLKRNEAQIYQKAHKLMGVHEYMLYHLCGVFVTDHSIASRTMLQSLHTLCWENDLSALFDIDREKLCEVQAQGSVCGVLSVAACQACGLPSGIPVVTAGGDQQCGALGLGITRPGQLEATTGTGAYVVSISDCPVVDPEMRFLCNVAAVPGQFVLEAPVLTAGNLYQWLAGFCFAECSGDVYADMSACAAQSPVGANGVVAFPYFKGCGAPLWDTTLKGNILNLSLDTQKGDVVRAVLEGLAFEISRNVRAMEESRGDVAGEILVSGGLTKSSLYDQILADMTQKNVCVGDDMEATAVGACMSASVALGVFASYEDAIAQLPEPEGFYHPIAEQSLQYDALNRERIELLQKIYT